MLETVVSAGEVLSVVTISELDVVSVPSDVVEGNSEASVCSVDSPDMEIVVSMRGVVERLSKSSPTSLSSYSLLESSSY